MMRAVFFLVLAVLWICAAHPVVYSEDDIYYENDERGFEWIYFEKERKWVKIEYPVEQSASSSGLYAG